MIRLFATTAIAVALGLLPILAGAAEPAKSTPAPAAAAANRAPSGPATYDSFRLIHTRNVFDPDRRPIRPPGLNAPQTTVAPTQADYAALTGTMVSTEKTYAFFSGSRPEFNKVLSVGSQFVRATIATITAQSIEIERDGKRTTVLVGQTVPFDNLSAPGEPPVEAAPPTETAPSSVSSPAASPAPAYSYRTGNYGGYRGGGNNNAANTPAPAATGPKGPPANVEEIRRRMMEKRQQELK